MTPDEIRITVSEIMWERDGCSHWVNKDHKYSEDAIKCMLNYPVSLNACAEFRKSLTIPEQIGINGYAGHLWNICARDYIGGTHGGGSTWLVIDATPIQHCEAFLRVKGKWK